MKDFFANVQTYRDVRKHFQVQIIQLIGHIATIILYRLSCLLPNRGGGLSFVKYCLQSSTSIILTRYVLSF